MVEAQDAAIAQLASMITKTLSAPILQMESAKEAWDFILSSHIRKDEVRAHAAVGKIHSLNLHLEEDPVIFTEKFESLFFSNFFLDLSLMI
jgi:hypothetical protein